jgi:hypothetical protein
MLADRVRKRVLALLALLALFAAPAADSAELEPAPEGIVAAEIAARAEAALRGRRRVLDGNMTFWKDGRSKMQAIRFRASDDREAGRSLIRILAPAAQAGRAFLKLPPNVWTWVPKDERFARIPPQQWHAPWLDGAFDNDDLLHLSDPVVEYEHRLLGVDPQPDGVVGLRAYVIESLAREGPHGASARLVSWIEVEHATLLRREIHDGSGALVRVLRFGGIREVQGRPFPHVWIARRIAWEGHETRIEVEGVWFDPELDADTFSTQRMRLPE